MIKLTQIDETNFLECFALRLDNGQERFVSSPIRSLAQAYVYRDQCMPFGIYAGKTTDLSALPDKATVLVPNDVTNEARALLLLEAQGLLKLKEGAGLEATRNEIVENPKNLDIVELEAAQIPRSLADCDIAVINGNYAIESGLKVADALATESSDSLAATTYGNVVAVREGDENREDIKALIEALTSPEVKAFMENKYEGAVVPMF